MQIPNNEYRISITSRCNMKCVYCHNEGNKELCELTILDIKNLLDNSYNLNLKSIRLTGGEPLLHKDIFEICKMIKETFKLNVGINTNGIEKDILLKLCSSGTLDRIVFGLDFYDAPISKKSLVGKSSKEILETILQIKNEFPNINISISIVYDNDYNNIKNILDFGIKNNIRIKILEKVEQKNDTSSEYDEMKDKVLKDYNLEIVIDKFNQTQGYLNNKNVVSFFHSHCKKKECDLCKNLSLRVNSDGKIRTCLFKSKETNYRKGNIRDNILNTIKNL
ncbi:MAG: radical SAM protein [Bacilli bacterium]|nr:radical SAM protein [Bacilli bacterium]